MKQIISFVLAVGFMVTLVGCGAKDPKDDVFRLVEKQYETIVTACETEDVEALLSVNGVKDVNIVDGYVLVFCKGTGISVSSQDYGFYYSKDNSPVAVDCNLDIVCYAEDLSPEGNGYQSIVSGNVFYTQHIKGNVYFYSNAY